MKFRETATRKIESKVFLMPSSTSTFLVNKTNSFTHISHFKHGIISTVRTSITVYQLEHSVESLMFQKIKAKENTQRKSISKET